MKKTLLALAALVATASVATAQSAIDAYNLSQSDLSGTARFMGMAGAFTALGGDISTLGQNPAGIGLYRSNDINVTFDINMASMRTADGMGYNETTNKTRFYCNNFGYVGAVGLDSDVMPYFSWGASFNRAASFDRVYSGGFSALGSSLSNYIAARATGIEPQFLGEERGYNPFSDSDADWLSIMGFNSYMINPGGVNEEGQQLYNGLYNPGSTTGDAQYMVREKGYIDEYNITFGGNFVNMLYWGLGFGITDLNYTSEAFYDEQLYNADVYDKFTNTTTVGDAYNALSNYSHVTGTGFNVKFGLIFKPVNEFRLGVAIHTPTWYSLSQDYDANIEYGYAYDFNAKGEAMTSYGNNYPSDLASWEWKLRSPWKFTVGAAGVIGGRFIVSADYEYNAWRNMQVSVPNRWNNYIEDTQVTDDVNTYFKASNTLRVGAEARITPQFSIRAGYSHTGASTEKRALDNNEYIGTSGCNPAYTFNKGTDLVTLGLGYRWSHFYLDAAWVNRSTNSSYHPFSPYYVGKTLMSHVPTASLKTRNNDIYITMGVKF